MMETDRIDILTLGEPLIEFMQLPESEPRVLYEQGFGGDTSNAAIAAARQGARVGCLTAVGDDAFGKSLMDLWGREGVRADHVQMDPQNPTGVYFVKPHHAGRQFTYARKGSAASQYIPEYLPVDAIRGARVLHASAVSQAISPSMRQSVRQAAQVAREAGRQFSFDTNLRLNLWSLEEARQASEEILPMASIIFPSVDEAVILTEISKIDDLLDYYLGFGAQVVVLKRGGDGVSIATPDARHFIAPASSQPVDSTGAGDSYAGAFLAYYLETGDALSAGQLAAKVAAATVSGFGAIEPIPYRNQIMAPSL